MAQLLVAAIEIFFVLSSIFPSCWLVCMLLTVFTLAKKHNISFPLVFSSVLDSALRLFIVFFYFILETEAFTLKYLNNIIMCFPQ